MNNTELNSQLLAGKLDALDTAGDLLEGNVPSKVGRAVLGLHVNAEGAEATVIGGAELVDGNVLGRVDELFGNLFGRLDLGVEGVDDADESDLYNATVSRHAP